jgi:hypothetical protein
VANVVKYLRDEASDYDNTSDLEARRTHIWHDVKVLHRWLTVRRVA